MAGRADSRRHPFSSTRLVAATQRLRRHPEPPWPSPLSAVATPHVRRPRRARLVVAVVSSSCVLDSRELSNAGNAKWWTCPRDTTNRTAAVSLDLARTRDSFFASHERHLVGALKPDGRTLTPLHSSLRQGLIAITVLALISFVASATLFLYLSYKLILWRFFIRDHPARDAQHPALRNASQPTANFYSWHRRHLP
ncbi:hypothetical protein ACCO45_009480 [Purpureocillium lilacinum]|uniref:Uncharacterized protein n=1 Tax=Purpureocillium lilacinum TaxID=33203 RepID=A0ACC4DL79_PURLI